MTFPSQPRSDVGNPRRWLLPSAAVGAGPFCSTADPQWAHVPADLDHTVRRFRPDGHLVHSWGEPGDRPGQFHLPHGIAVGADRENSRVQPLPWRLRKK